MSFLKLIRFQNLIMILLTMILTKFALIDSLFKETQLTHIQFTLLVLSVLSITAAGYIVNDIYDVKADKRNKPHKVFIGVSISKNTAWKSYFFLNILGITLGIYLSTSKHLPYYSLYFILTSIVLFCYSKYLKSMFLIGNIIVSLLCCLVIYLVVQFERIEILKKPNAVALKIIFIAFYLFSFLTTLIREIIKDIEDINGDLLLKANTLPIVIGRKRASSVAFFCASMLLLLLLLVIQFVQHKIVFFTYSLLFLVLPLLYFMYLLWKANSKKDYSKLSTLMKLIMFFGILSMLIFRFKSI